MTEPLTSGELAVLMEMSADVAYSAATLAAEMAIQYPEADWTAKGAPTMAYAEATKVSVEKSVAEIVTLVRRNAGSQIAQLDDDDRYVIAFSTAERQVRFVVTFDPVTHKRFQVDGRGSQRTAAQRRDHWEQHRRQRMRAMLLVIKAKFESVESGVETFEQAFLANVVTSSGLTVYERIAEDLSAEYQTGAVRPLMLGAPR